jgi:menaquinol-cytochrome c reductase iron-sulfur subunit
MDDIVNRRRFFSRLSIGLGGLAGAALGVPIVGYLLSPLINPPRDVWRDLGPVDNFNIGGTVEVAIEEPSPLPWAGQTARTAAWLRRVDDSTFTAFSVNCTHLGCPVNWRPDSSLFLCPCHGGVYYADGEVAGGPPPRSLFQYEVRVSNGNVQIRTGALPLG